MFATYPGIDGYRSRRPVPMGDGGGRLFGGDRDKALSARRILVNRFRDDPDHRAVHAFNETTPRSSVGVYAYRDAIMTDSVRCTTSTTICGPSPTARSWSTTRLSNGPRFAPAE
jgi:hypothetical protein